MIQINFKIAVKNMVCNRCIKVVKEELRKNDIAFVNVELGEIEFKNEVSEENKMILKNILKKEGFELTEDVESKTINRAKALIIQNIHYNKKKPANLFRF